MGVSAIPPDRPLIIWHPLDTAPPGYVKANAPTVSRTAYAWAFAKFGTKYGAGDGVTTFVLGPDLRGEFPRGWDDGRGVDPGRVNGSFQNHMYEDHAHVVKGTVIGLLLGGTNVTVPNGGYGDIGVGGGATSGQAGAETRGRNIAGLFCIAIAP